ncbi:hypothetical protein CDAR_107491 [Caerostris darwini]|uniref:Uncharacterized protein n=1 Tax=Caerostris darwini TaxID=1538125 RepID=A0AAV4RN88_9ARAC|nr:hypothetical protein CDAR_107491 [Caerostris darwini]
MASRQTPRRFLMGLIESTHYVNEGLLTLPGHPFLKIYSERVKLPPQNMWPSNKFKYPLQRRVLFTMPCLGYYAIDVRSIQQISKTHPINRSPRVVDALSSMANFLARIIKEDTTLGYWCSVCSSGCG